jgi:hypothetical protein
LSKAGLLGAAALRGEAAKAKARLLLGGVCFGPLSFEFGVGTPSS